MMVSHVCTTSSLNYELSLDACESCANDIIHHTESPCAKRILLGPAKHFTSANQFLCFAMLVRKRKILQKT